MALFNGAKNVVVNGGSFVANASNPPKGGFDRLVAEVAPNAILNAGGRADEVRCFPGTREEVIARLEEFMDDDGPDKKRMMWLSGPAGAGKSAICQTVAERRSEQGRQAANFFFFRGDSTRSHSKPLVATLVYQLRRFYPGLDEPLSDCLDMDPLICSASVETQFNQLISSPIPTIRQSTPTQQRIAIIIDGLDECSNERDQDQILVALHALAHADDSPFLILVSSRAEPHLVMSFNRLGSSVASIFLNDDYKPQKDIRLFVVAKFDEIKRDHHLARTLGEKWPTPADVDAITNKSSGQFIYAATVMRYIQFSSESPALSLATILEILPSTDHNPLAHLDAVYSYIFSNVRNIRAVKLILFARHCTISSGREHAFVPILRLAGYDDIKVQSYFANLAAVIRVVPGSDSDILTFYHASLEDYLSNKSRSTIYHMKEPEIAAEFSSMCFRNIHDSYSVQLALISLARVPRATPELTKSLLDASNNYLSDEREVPFLDKLIAHIKRLYQEQDKDQFNALLQSWSRFVYVNDLDDLSRMGMEPNTLSIFQYFDQLQNQLSTGYGGQERHGLAPPYSIVPAALTRSNTQIVSTTVSPNATIGEPFLNLSVHTPGASPGECSYNDGMGTVTPEQLGMMAGPSRSQAFLSVFHERFDPLGRKASRRQLRSTSRPVSVHEEDEEGSGSREYDSGSDKLSTIRVKIHYQDNIRSMTFPPSTPFSEFVNKLTTKFGKNFDNLTVKFKDQDGDKITLQDDSDYEHAIETARLSSKGKATGKLEIWCQDSV